MAFGETSLAILYYGPETAGTPPTEPGGWGAGRFTSMGISPDIQTGQSSEITAGRVPREDIRTDASGIGDVGFELIYGAHDNIWTSLFSQSSLTNEASLPSQTDGYTITNADTNPTLTSATGGAAEDAFANSLPGQILWFTTGNGWTADVAVPIKRVIDANTVELLTEANELTNETGNTVIVMAHWSIGETKKPLWFEKILRDPANPGTVASPTVIYSEMYESALVASVSHSFRPGEAAAPGTFNIQGEFPSVSNSRQGTTQAFENPSGGRSPMNSLTDVKKILVGRNSASGLATDYVAETAEFSWNLDNNVARDAAVGAFGAVNVRLGIPTVNGNLNLFIQDTQEINRLINNQGIALSLAVEDGDGNKMWISACDSKFSTAATPIGSGNDPAFLNMGWTGKSLILSQDAA